MRFKVDENLPSEIGELLRNEGHEATTVLEQSLGGVDDREIPAICQREQRVIITLDTDFADIRAYPPSQYAGIIALRLRWQDKPHVKGTFTRLIQMLSQEPLAGHLWIVEEGRIRIRGEEYPQQF